MVETVEVHLLNIEKVLKKYNSHVDIKILQPKLTIYDINNPYSFARKVVKKKILQIFRLLVENFISLDFSFDSR